MYVLQARGHQPLRLAALPKAYSRKVNAVTCTVGNKQTCASCCLSWAPATLGWPPLWAGIGVGLVWFVCCSATTAATMPASLRGACVLLPPQCITHTAPWSFPVLPLALPRLALPGAVPACFRELSSCKWGAQLVSHDPWGCKASPPCRHATACRLPDIGPHRR
jgi:hypothetical protein